MSVSDHYFDVGVIARFLSKIAFAGNDDCWLWTGGRTSDGYGVFSVRNPIVKTAHRYMVELMRGERLERGIDASHTCETRHCVNPRHLVAETHLENCQRRRTFARGFASPRRKLTWEQALEIRSSPEPLRVLVERYQSNTYTIWAIKHGVSYKVPPRQPIPSGS